MFRRNPSMDEGAQVMVPVHVGVAFATPDRLRAKRRAHQIKPRGGTSHLRVWCASSRDVHFEKD